MSKTDNQYSESVNLASLFLEHAGGLVTERALRERRKRIIHEIQRGRPVSREVEQELDEIEDALGESEPSHA